MLRRRSAARAAAEAVAFPLLVGSAALAIADLGRRIFRHTQIFVPSRAPMKSWDPADYGIPPEAVEEQWIETPDGQFLHAWYCRAEKPVASGLFCHGNTGNLTVSADVIPHLLRAGFSVLFFDYRGFGRSSGRPSVAGVIADGVTAAKFHDRIRPPELPSVLYGFSLGGAIAAQVIRRHHFDGLILQSTFTSLPHITRVLFPRLPLHLLAGDLFNTLAVVERLQVPLLVIHGTHDEVAPCFMGRQLYAACSGKKRLHCVEGGLHKDLFFREPEALIATIARFIAELPRDGHTFAVEESSPFERWSNDVLRKVRRSMRRKSPQHT